MARGGVGVALGAVASLLLLGRPAAQDHTTFADTAAENLFRYSRAAISGGGGPIMRLRSLVFKGRSRVLVDDRTLVPATVEIKFLLPDHYLRTHTIGDSHKLAGYAGKTLPSAIVDHGTATHPPDGMRSQILQNERWRAARLLLGTATYVGADLVLTFRSVPKSVDMVDPRVSARTRLSTDSSSNAEPFVANVTGDSFSARFVVDGTTRAPSQLVFPGTDRNPVTMTFEDRRGRRPAPAVSHRHHHVRTRDRRAPLRRDPRQCRARQERLHAMTAWVARLAIPSA